VKPFRQECDSERESDGEGLEKAKSRLVEDMTRQPKKKKDSERNVVVKKRVMQTEKRERGRG